LIKKNSNYFKCECLAKKIREPELLQKTYEIIAAVMLANKLEEIKNIKKLVWYKHHY